MKTMMTVLANRLLFPRRLHLFKREKREFQKGLVTRNAELESKNLEIEQQKQEIQEKAELLEKQTHDLKELDQLKTRLFSIISHDLRTPLYALRNLFRNIEKHDVPGDEIKMMIPGIVTDLNFTTGLMENLLQWAKSQMHVNSMKPELLDISKMIKDVFQLLRLQAAAKQIYLDAMVDTPIYIYADKDMINLVLRNLLSNAIKFTNEKGQVSIGAHQLGGSVEVFVQDTGTGMDKESMQRINESMYFSTKGTANESGTGIGLMLCKEFLVKNGGRMFVESEQGKGSTFSFTLPANECLENSFIGEVL
jgi:signal transduction histidine kinase